MNEVWDSKDGYFISHFVFFGDVDKIEWGLSGNGFPNCPRVPVRQLIGV